MDIGIVMPAKDCAGLLKAHLMEFSEVISSVAQVVAVDGCSTDGTSEVLKSVRHDNGFMVYGDNPASL